jgi:FKBP-type peptidyl-prolyl cis-trans isomerase 2
MRAVMQGDFVIMDFSGKDEAGNLVISSDAVGQEDFAWEIGKVSQLPKGLHDMVVGMDAGQTKSATVAPADAMGERRDELVFQVPKSVRTPCGHPCCCGCSQVSSTTDGRHLRRLPSDCSLRARR